MMINVIFSMMVSVVLLMAISQQTKKIDRQYIIIWVDEKEDTTKTVNDQDKKKKLMKGKYGGGQTAILLREKLTREDKTEEIKEDYDRLYNNHYNACSNECAKRTLRKNHPDQKKKTFSEYVEEFKTTDPNMYIFWQTAFAKDPFLEQMSKICVMKDQSIVLLYRAK